MESSYPDGANNKLTLNKHGRTYERTAWTLSPPINSFANHITEHEHHSSNRIHPTKQLPNAKGTYKYVPINTEYIAARSTTHTT